MASDDFSSLVPPEDAVLVSNFATSHTGFTLSPTTYPPPFRRMAYQTFAHFWRFLGSHSIWQLLTEHKDYIIVYIQTLRCFGFSGDWFEKMSHSLQRSIPTFASEDFQKLFSEKSACTSQVTQLQQEFAQLSNRLEVIKSELADKNVELELLASKQKVMEEARAAFYVPYYF